MRPIRSRGSIPISAHDVCRRRGLRKLGGSTTIELVTVEKASLPNVAELLAPLLARVPRERQPLFLAIAERLAAERYRGWAANPAYAAHRSRLLACALREEEIAAHVEALRPDAKLIQQEILAANPDLMDINRDLFAKLSLADQMRTQASGERAGAGTWRAFAEHAKDPSASATFLACAKLEEESALVLDDILGR